MGTLTCSGKAEYSVSIDHSDDWAQIDAWCNETFTEWSMTENANPFWNGSTVVDDPDRTYWFLTEQDATLFKLKWK